MPSFEHEHQYWQQGIRHVAGIDEVGMGALAGPVVAGAVIFDAGVQPGDLLQVRDSKQLTPKQRTTIAEQIKTVALTWAVGEASVAEINTFNIRQASHLAMQRAIEALAVQPKMLLVDGNPVQLHPDIPAVNLIKGDELSFSIAAASILAKVYRDGLMKRLDENFPGYGFAHHKGYGSPVHLAALKEHGPCAHHRKKYAPVAALLTKAV